MNEKEILLNIKYCLVTKQMMNKKLLNNYLKILLKKYNLYNLVNTINLNSDINYYSNSSKEIGINYIECLIKDRKIINDNISLLEIVYHELTHCFQMNMISNNNIKNNLSFFYKTLCSNFYDASINNSFYNKYYDSLIFEYQANIVSKLKVLDILKYLKIDDLQIEQSYEIAKYITKSYKDSSPLEIASNYSYKNNNKLDNYEKLMFGYPIDKTILNVIKNISDQKVKTYDIIKHII